MTATTKPISEFPTGVAARLAGMKTATLAYWCREHADEPPFFRASLRQAAGAGQGKNHGHLFSFRDVVALRALVRLRERGVSLQRLRKVGEYLRESRGWESPLSRAWLVLAGDDVHLLAGGQIESTLKDPGQLGLAPAMFVSLEETAREVRQAAESLRKAA